MPDAWTILGLLLATISLAAAVYWSVAIGRILRTRRELPTADDGVNMPCPAGRVCVAIPAHNEAAVLPELIATLRAQETPPQLAVRFVLALDRCTDGSADACRRAIDGDPRFTLVEIAECEPGWAGKVHAVYRGVHDGGSLNDDYLLFADADTLFHPRCVRATVSLLHARGLGMLSLLSTMRYMHWFELLVQPSCGLELVRQYPLLRANDAANRRAFANGQFMLFTREAYSRFGGHHEVRRELLEDLRFARVLEYYSIPQGVFIASEMLICRMYASWPQFVKGWKRIFQEAANRKPGRLVAHAAQLSITVSGFPAATIASIWFAAARWSQSSASPFALGAGLAGLVAFGIAMALVSRTAKAPPLTALASPLGALIAAGILLRAALDLATRRPTQWAGMAYDRSQRR